MLHINFKVKCIGVFLKQTHGIYILQVFHYHQHCSALHLMFWEVVRVPKLQSTWFWFKT